MPDTLTFPTWVRDPVHGAIRVTDLERSIIDCAVVQRLRRVKQLGLACLAFPSADYSRFEHSLGVMEVTGRLIQSVNRSRAAGNKIQANDIQLYRLAALLHDVGHYPFSHAMEDAIGDYYGTGSPALVSGHTKPLDHEALGWHLIAHDDELSAKLAASKIDPKDIIGILEGKDIKWQYHNMVSSDLDADRLDYLARTSRHTGMPYGKTDIDYLIQGVREDDQGRVCFDEKALRSIEHLLLARFFDFETMVRHRVVAGTECLLKDVIKELFRRNDDIKIDCSHDGVVEMIRSKKWPRFDDLALMERLRLLEERSPADEILRAKLRCVLHRAPPKAAAEAEWLTPDRAATEEVSRAKKELESRVDGWATKFGIDRRLWFIWTPTKGPTRFTKARAGKDGFALDDAETPESARVMAVGSKNSKAVVGHKRSIMNILAQHSFCAVRVFVVPPIGEVIDKDRKQVIRKQIEADVALNWK